MTNQISQNSHIADFQSINNDFNNPLSESGENQLLLCKKENLKSRKQVYSRMFRDRHSSTQFNGASLPSAAERSNSGDKFPASFLQKYKLSVISNTVNTNLTATERLVKKSIRILNINFCLNNHFVEL